MTRRSIVSPALATAAAGAGLTLVSRNTIPCPRCGLPVPVADWGYHTTRACLVPTPPPAPTPGPAA